MESCNECIRLIPILNKLKEDTVSGRVKNEVIPFSTFQRFDGFRVKELLEEASIEYKTSSDYDLSIVNERVSTTRAELIQELERLEFDSSPQDYNMKYRGVPLFPFLRGGLNLLPNSLYFLKLAEHIIDCEKPDLIMVGYEATEGPMKAAVFIAKTRGIPSLLVQYALFTKDQNNLPHYTDRIACWGPKSRDQYIDGGIPPEKIIVTGTPTNDLFIKKRKEFNRLRICEELGIDPEKKVVVLATIPIVACGGKEYNMIIPTFCRIINEIPGLQLVIRPHPETRDENYLKHLLEEKGYVGIINRNVDILKLLYIADLFITTPSTTVVEAALFNTQIMLVHTKELFDREFSEERIAFILKISGDPGENSGSLKEGIKSLLFDEKIKEKFIRQRDEYVYDYMYKVDGEVSTRIANLIYSLIQESKDSNS
jgi:hypothetical protein